MNSTWTERQLAQLAEYLNRAREARLQSARDASRVTA